MKDTNANSVGGKMRARRRGLTLVQIRIGEKVNVLEVDQVLLVLLLMVGVTPLDVLAGTLPGRRRGATFPLLLTPVAVLGSLLTRARRSWPLRVARRGGVSMFMLMATVSTGAGGVMLMQSRRLLIQQLGHGGARAHGNGRDGLSQAFRLELKTSAASTGSSASASASTIASRLCGGRR